MKNSEWMTIQAAANALSTLAEELDAAHASPFLAHFFDEHWEAIERAIDRLVDATD